MLTINVDRELKEQLGALKGLADAARKATHFATTDTVKDLHYREDLELKASFDNPTPWLKRGLKKRFPGGSWKTPISAAGVYFEEFPIRGNQNDVVAPHVFGGPRGLKRNERRLGNLPGVGSGMAVMGRNYPHKNSYGNIPGHKYQKMLHQLGQLSEFAPTSKATRKHGVSSSVKGTGKAIGIKEKRGKFYIVRESSGGSRKGKRKADDGVFMLVFVNQATYRKRYDFFGVGRKTINEYYPRHWSRLFEKYRIRLGAGETLPATAGAMQVA